MIKLKRPAAPSTLLTKGRAAARALKASRTKGSINFNFKSDIYAAGDVRKKLRTMHHGKCAFCESSLPQLTAGHVEHFRPKGEVQQDIGEKLFKPGYYWLAYDWDNLLLACEWCNSRAKKKIFPLKTPLKVAPHHRKSIDNEIPLLINPSIQDPDLHIEFIKEVIKPKKNSLAGSTSIRVYRLDDEGLTDSRREQLNLFNLLLKFSRNTNSSPEAAEALAELNTWIKLIKSGKTRYAAMLQQNLPKN